MRKIKDRICYLAVLTLGVSVLMGWIFDIETLKRVRDGWVSMKTFTAICFILSGYISFVIVENDLWPNERANFRTEIKRASVASAALMMMFGMVVMGMGHLFLRQPLLARLVATEHRDPMSLLPGVPSVLTMIAFSGVALFALFSHPEAGTSVRESVRWIVLSIGLSGLIGYALDLPALYGYWEGHSGAMAIHTAIGFIILSCIGYPPRRRADAREE